MNTTKVDYLSYEPDGCYVQYTEGAVGHATTESWPCQAPLPSLLRILSRYNVSRVSMVISSFDKGALIDAPGGRVQESTFALGPLKGNSLPT